MGEPKLPLVSQWRDWKSCPIQIPANKLIRSNQYPSTNIVFTLSEDFGTLFDNIDSCYATYVLHPLISQTKGVYTHA